MAKLYIHHHSIYHFLCSENIWNLLSVIFNWYEYRQKGILNIIGGMWVTMAIVVNWMEITQESRNWITKSSRNRAPGWSTDISPKHLFQIPCLSKITCDKWPVFVVHRWCFKPLLKLQNVLLFPKFLVLLLKSHLFRCCCFSPTFLLHLSTDCYDKNNQIVSNWITQIIHCHLLYEAFVSHIKKDLKCFLPFLSVWKLRLQIIAFCFSYKR